MSGLKIEPNFNEQGFFMCNSNDFQPTMFTVETIEQDCYKAPLLRFKKGAWDSPIVEETTFLEIKNSLSFIASLIPSAQGEPCPCVVIDMQEILDSPRIPESAYGIPIRIIRSLIKKHDLYVVVALIGVDRNVQAIIEFTHLNMILPLYQHQEEAIADIRNYPRVNTTKELFELLHRLTGSSMEASPFRI
jgi:hypothetical protein